MIELFSFMVYTGRHYMILRVLGIDVVEVWELAEREVSRRYPKGKIIRLLNRRQPPRTEWSPFL